MLAFEVTPDDFQQAAPFAPTSLFGRLDFEAIEKAALHGTDMDDQIRYAYEEIAHQARNMMGMTPMQNGAITKAFLASIDQKTKASILCAIAQHYAISTDEAEIEVCDPEAEHLLDYLVEPQRSATSLIMQKHGFR